MHEMPPDAPFRYGRRLGLLIAALTLGTLPSGLYAQSLQGSAASLDVQNRIARQHDFTYIESPNRVRFFAEQGWLVRVRPTGDFRLDNEVSFPYARPEVALFVRRLGAQYRSACGEQLVVTSLTRPTTRQPRNASDRSVHPTGMAVDLRRSQRLLLEPERQDGIDTSLVFSSDRRNGVFAQGCYRHFEISDRSQMRTGSRFGPASPFMVVYVRRL